MTVPRWRFKMATACSWVTPSSASPLTATIWSPLFSRPSSAAAPCNGKGSAQPGTPGPRQPAMVPGMREGAPGISLTAMRNGGAEPALRARPAAPHPTRADRVGFSLEKRPGWRLALDLLIMERLGKAAFKCTPCLTAEKQLKKGGGRGNQPRHCPQPQAEMKKWPRVV